MKFMMKTSLVICLFVATLALTGCSGLKNSDTLAGSLFSNKGKENNESGSTESGNEQMEVITFEDESGELRVFNINPEAKRIEYDSDKFVKKNGKVSYTGDGYDTTLGVDVSYHQGEINWTKVKEAGYTFAYIRLGYRGYSKSGTLNVDTRYRENIVGAKAAGLQVGVYFFSQAISDAEAIEEANFVLENVKGYRLDLPIVFDPESIPDANARTDGVSGRVFTSNAMAFFQTIEKAGYSGMLYSNARWEALMFDMGLLKNYPIWYADYGKTPRTPYAFNIWQYTESGKVPGIKGRTDINVMMVPKQ